MHALDRRELRDARRLKPIEEFRRRARIGAARVRVPDLRGKEFEETIGGACARCRDKCGGVRSDEGGELVHAVTPCIFQSGWIIRMSPASNPAAALIGRPFQSSASLGIAIRTWIGLPSFRVA